MRSSIVFFEPDKDIAIHYTFAIILSKFRGRWVFVRHRDRESWELPAGRVEPGETVEEAAVRELREETGALEFKISPLVSYRGDFNGRTVYGKLFRAEIIEIGPLPEFEIVEISLFDEVPDNLTYPDIQPRFIEWYENNS